MAARACRAGLGGQRGVHLAAAAVDLQAGPVPDGPGTPPPGSAPLAGGLVRAAAWPDPVQLIIESDQAGWTGCVPVRVGRMAATPYGFLRGVGVVMAADVAGLP